MTKKIYDARTFVDDMEKHFSDLSEEEREIAVTLLHAKIKSDDLASREIEKFLNDPEKVSAHKSLSKILTALRFEKRKTALIDVATSWFSKTEEKLDKINKDQGKYSRTARKFGAAVAATSFALNVAFNMVKAEYFDPPQQPHNKYAAYYDLRLSEESVDSIAGIEPPERNARPPRRNALGQKL